MAGVSLPITSHPLQACVTEPLKPFLDKVIVSANLHVYVNQSDRGELVLAAAETSRYTELGRAQVCGKTWHHPAYADGKLYIREGLTSGWKLTCLTL